MNRRTFVLVLAAALCLANATRWAYRSHFGRERFAAESAAHFRYMRMIAAGERIPDPDRHAQWPEGLQVARETSIGMEYVYGLAWRALPPSARPALEEFAGWFPALLFTLSALPLALLSASLWHSRGAGAVTALLFAVALPVSVRSSGFELIRENFTLPLIVTHAWLLCRAAGGRRAAALLSAPVIFLALATWQGTQFYIVPLLALLLARMIAGASDSDETAAGWALVLAAAAAGALVPFLRAGRFLVSPTAALAAAWIAAALLDRYLRARSTAADKMHESAATDKARVLDGAGKAPGPDSDKARVPDGAGKKRVSRLGVILPRAAAAAVAAAAVLVPAALAAKHFAVYSHLFRLVAAKLQHVYKPSDPSALTFDVRAFWVGPFHSPDALHLFVFALPLLILLPGPAARLARLARGGEFSAVFCAVMTPVFFVLFLLMQRMLPFFGVFAVVVAGGLAVSLWDSGRARGALRLLPLVLVIVVMTLQALFWAGPGDVWRSTARALRIPQRRSFVVYPFRPDPEGEMLSWIGRSTAPGDVILSLHYLSPQILTYTGRPTVLNDFFEAPRLREKTRRFLQSLYSSERSLLGYCREHGSDWLVLSAAVGCDPTLDSPLYQAGHANMPPDCAAYRLMFEPQRLDSFDLVFENEMYRIFRVGTPYSERRAPRSPLFYESELLWLRGGDMRDFYNTVMRMYALTSRAAALERAGRPAEAEGLLSDVLRTFYFHPAWLTLDRLYARTGRHALRLTLARFAREFDPWRASVCLALAESALAAGERETAAEAVRVCADLEMDAREAERFRRLAAAADQNP